jgi:hypothetical protein
MSANVKIVDDMSGRFCGIGFVSADGEVKAIRMCVGLWEE